MHTSLLKPLVLTAYLRNETHCLVYSDIILHRVQMTYMSSFSWFHNHIFLAMLWGDMQWWLGIWYMGKETWRSRKALSSIPSSAWSLVIYLTSLGFHMLSHILVAFPQKMKWECMECPSHGTWHSVRAQKYQFPLSVKVSPSRRWKALIKWLGSVDTHHSCLPAPCSGL